MQSTKIPGSEGLWSPRVSPDGKHIVAHTNEAQPKLMLYTFAEKKWRPLPGGKSNGWEAWSHDSKYVFAYDYANHYIIRVGISNGKVETAASLEGVRWTTFRFRMNGWFDLTPDDRIMILRDTGSEDIYALKLEY